MIGYKLVKYQGFSWKVSQKGLFPLSPPRALPELDVKSARALIKKNKAWFARWESHFDELDKSDWWHIIKDGGADLGDLSANTRSKVRRGLRTYYCVPLSRETILNDAYDPYYRAFSRYKTHERTFLASEFREAIGSLPIGTEFWAVREKETNRLVAFSENYVEGNVCFYNTIWFEPLSLKKYSSYALFYEMNRHYLVERSMLYISDGARNLSHATQIHDFLVSKFGFRKAYAKLNVVYAPWLNVLVGLAYPFRGWLSRVPFAPFKKASILLSQEQCRKASSI